MATDNMDQERQERYASLLGTGSTNRARADFLVHLARTGNVTESAAVTGLPRRSVYNWRDADETFRALWDEAEEIAVDALRAEARRRGVEGIDKPVYYQGKRVDVIKEYSDRMLELLLKRHDPAFRETVRQEHTGANGGPIETVTRDLSAFSDDELRQLRALRDRVASE